MSRFGMIVEDPTYNEEGQLDDIDDWLSAVKTELFEFTTASFVKVLAFRTTLTC